MYNYISDVTSIAKSVYVLGFFLMNLFEAIEMRIWQLRKQTS